MKSYIPYTSAHGNHHLNLHVTKVVKSGKANTKLHFTQNSNYNEGQILTLSSPLVNLCRGPVFTTCKHSQTRTKPRTSAIEGTWIWTLGVIKPPSWSTPNSGRHRSGLIFLQIINISNQDPLRQQSYPLRCNELHLEKRMKWNKYQDNFNFGKIA